MAPRKEKKESPKVPAVSKRKTPTKKKDSKPVKKSTPKKKPSTKSPPSPPSKKINCMLPGAELLAEGKSVEEIMETLEKQQATELTVQEERFCQEYVSCDVAVRAALRVWPELNYNVAHNKASRLLQNATIKARVDQITEEHKERYGLTDAKILKRLASLAMFDRRTLHKEDGSLKQIHELSEEEAAAITEIESVELFDGKGDQRQAIGMVRKVKFADPKGAIELAGRHLKLWKDVGSKENPLVGGVDYSFNLHPPEK